MSKSKAVSHQVAEEVRILFYFHFINNKFQAISSIRTIRSFAAEKRCIDNFDKTIDKTELVARREWVTREIYFITYSNRDIDFLPEL